MTSNASLLWSLIRCVLIASIAVWPVAAVVSRIEASSSVYSRRLRFLLAVFPFFVPELLIGFNYRLTVTQLTSEATPFFAAICTEVLYGVLMLSRCMAVGVALSMLLPRSNATDESLHSWVLLRRVMPSTSWWRGWLTLKIFGSWQASLAAWSAMALMAFQEFETAALMQIDQSPISWSVWLFDAHAARLPLLDSLRMTVVPLLCEFAIMCPALCVILLKPASYDQNLVTDNQRNSRDVVGKSVRFSALLTPGVVLFALWPLINNFLTIVRGGILILDRATFTKSFVQILTSTGFAIGATVLAIGISSQFCSAMNSARVSMITKLFFGMLLLPGLLGSLVLSLILLAMFQLPVLRGLYDTWLPMLLGQTFAVLPFAMAVVLLLMRGAEPKAVHSADLLNESSESRIRQNMATIRWRLTTSRWLVGGLIVAHRCFWDVTVASILRPVDLEPVITRLYNEMHYGRTEALMSLSMLATLTPLAIAAIALILSRTATLLMPPREHGISLRRAAERDLPNQSH